MIGRGLRHSWLHGSDRPGARVPAPAVRSQGDETPRGSVERRHSRIVNGRVSVERRHSRSRIAKKDVEDQCGFQTIDVFVGTGCAQHRAWPISAAAHGCTMQPMQVDRERSPTQLATRVRPSQTDPAQEYLLCDPR